MTGMPLGLLALSATLAIGLTASLSISGDVPTPVTLTIADLEKMPRIKLDFQEHQGKASYEGVPLGEVLKKAGVPFGKQLRGKALASYVLAKARDGYEVTFALPELDPDFKDVDNIIVADKRDGQPLTGTLGPLRIIVGSDKIPARSIRMLEKLQIVMLRN